MRPFALAFVLTAAVVAATAPALGGCAGQSRPARMQEAASELNLNARFGRMEIASEHVAVQARDAFFARRKVWGARVRIVDSELVSVRFEKDESEAKATVRIAWQPVDDGDMRQTLVRQTYKDLRNGWFLIAEEHADGVIGLFGEKPPEAPKDAPKANPRKGKFDTIRLGQTESTTTNSVDDPATP